MISKQRIDAILVVPPFVRLNTASLGVHLLQAFAKESGFNINVHYANIEFANLIGEDLYYAISFSDEKNMLGERIFCSEAYDVPNLGKNSESELKYFNENVRLENGSIYKIDYKCLKDVSIIASKFIDIYASSLLKSAPRIIGCTSMFPAKCMFGCDS